MKRLRKPLMIGLVWLTAAMTAVAGTPYLLCHCANGAIQLPGLFSSSQACCARKLAQKTAPKPRCPHCRPPAANPVGPQLSRPGCHWTTAQPVAFCGSDSRPVLSHQGATGALLPVAILGL